MTIINGFTLVELLIAMVVIAILSAIAIPSYTLSVQRSARAEAVTNMLELASKLAEIKTVTMKYKAGDGETNHTSRYQITATLDEEVGYVIKATPQDGQKKDPCGELVYQASGIWLFEGGLSYDDCVS